MVRVTKSGKLYIVCAIAGLALKGAVATAGERTHEAHVHGVGKLNLAVEGNTVEMELEVPADDIVGFEHAPSTDADRAAVERAEAQLRAGDELFLLPAAAECRLQEAALRSPLMEHREDNHGDKHAGEHAEKETGGGHDTDAESETHAEFHAHYRFHCAEPSALTYVGLRYFERFSGARKLDVQAITSRGQRLQVLTPEAARLRF